MSSEPLLYMKSITKVYPDGTVALRGADFEVKRGEVHGLLGENGAGKTTLAKIMSGLLPPTDGEILLRSARMRFRSPAEALAHGIGMVHQHFTLVPNFTAVQNIVLGKEGAGPLSPLRLADARKKISELMEKTGLRVPLEVPVELLPVGVQQRVEILKLLYRNVDLLILDEPTSALAPLEVTSFFEMLLGLTRGGKTIIFITHKLREVLEISDRITVLRHGQVAGKLSTREATPLILAEMMVGMKELPSISRGSKPPGNPVLVVEHAQVRNDFGGLATKDLSFEVRSGEIFGIAGVEGNGQTELVQAVTGLRRLEKGRILLNRTDIAGKKPKELYKAGLSHIPEDRRKLGLILDFNVAENSILSLQEEERFKARANRLIWTRIYDYASGLVTRFGILTPSLKTLAKNLSGGNQQRLVVARELVKAPVLVVVAQPTRGLDVAATQYIRELLIKIRDEGKAVLMVSADLDEVMQLADRVAVMYEGKFMGVTKAGELERKTIGLMMGGIQAA